MRELKNQCSGHLKPRQRRDGDVVQPECDTDKLWIQPDAIPKKGNKSPSHPVFGSF